MTVNQSNDVPKGSRRAIRRVVELGCELVTRQHDEPLRYNASDLSPYGMWIQTPEPMRTGEELVVCFEPPGVWGGGELMLFAEVARVATARRCLDLPGIGMGLEFTDLSKCDHHLLARWLGSRKTPVPRRRRPVPRHGWRVPPPPFRKPEPVAFRPVGSAWR
jgi:hypothetical protein